MRNHRFFFFLFISSVIHGSILFINFSDVFAKNDIKEIRFLIINNSKKISKDNKIKKIAKLNSESFYKNEETLKDSNMNSQDYKDESNIEGESEKEILEFDFNTLHAPKIFNFKPSYPLSLKRLSKNGIVEIKICVDVDGSMCGYEIIQSSHKKFEESVVSALNEAYFEPAVLNGKKIKSYGRLKVRFELEDI